MIKSLLILVLTLALAAAAFLTRPSPASFRQMVRDDLEQQSDNLLEKVTLDLRTDAYMDKLQFKDRYLWIDVQRNDQTVYTGAFAHWFKRGETARP